MAFNRLMGIMSGEQNHFDTLRTLRVLKLPLCFFGRPYGFGSIPIPTAVIATYADPATTAPIYICAGLFIVLAIVSALFPFEPYGRRSN